MKRTKYFFIALVCCYCTMSCKKNFLDVPDKSILIRQAYVVDLKTTGDFLNGIYVELAVNFYNLGTLNFLELIGDNMKPMTGSPIFPAQYSWSQQADDSRYTGPEITAVNVNGLWFSGFKIARDCSFVIETVDKYRDQDPVKADNIKGQAHALRALVHSVLVNVFAQSYPFTPGASHTGIPYITSSDWSKPLSRQTVAEVYTALVADLNNAISLLPVTQTIPASGFNYSLMSKNAAKALLARVYLFKGDYMAAKNAAKEVGTDVPIMTGANYPSKLFTNQETEALFQLPPSRSEVATGDAGSYSTTFAAAFYVAPNLQLLSTSDIALVLKEDPLDVRKAWVTQNGSNWEIRKFPINVIAGFPIPATSYFQTLLRSSEMYLTASESYARLNNEDSARFYLNAIRTRASIAPVSSSITGTALLDSIFKERRKELAFEGFRMFDLQRWKQDVNRNDAPLPAAKILTYGSNKAISPIPLSDVNLAGLPQNSGY